MINGNANVVEKIINAGSTVLRDIVAFVISRCPHKLKLISILRRRALKDEWRLKSSEFLPSLKCQRL